MVPRVALPCARASGHLMLACRAVWSHPSRRRLSHHCPSRPKRRRPGRRRPSRRLPSRPQRRCPTRHRPTRHTRHRGQCGLCPIWCHAASCPLEHRFQLLRAVWRPAQTATAASCTSDIRYMSGGGSAGGFDGSSSARPTKWWLGRRWFGRRGRRRGGRRRHGLRQIVDRSWLGRSWLRPRQHGRLRRLEQLLALSQPARPRLDACLSRCGARSCVISGCWII